jgi:hypothetical protein
MKEASSSRAGYSGRTRITRCELIRAGELFDCQTYLRDSAPKSRQNERLYSDVAPTLLRTRAAAQSSARPLRADGCVSHLDTVVAPSGSAGRITTCQHGLDKEKAKDYQGFSDKRLKGLEPSTFCMASRRSSQLSYSREAPGV